MGTMVTPEQIERITSLLEERFGLDALWIYGSEATGTATADSDVDLAGLFQRRPEGLEIFDARSDLVETLQREVDLVDLDQVSPILGMQVLKHGRLVVDRNPGRRHVSYFRILSLYDDLMPLRREAEEATRRRLRA